MDWLLEIILVLTSCSGAGSAGTRRLPAPAARCQSAARVRSVGWPSRGARRFAAPGLTRARIFAVICGQAAGPTRPV